MNKLLILVLFLAATAVFATDETSGEWTSTTYKAASSTNTASPSWAYLWGKENDDTYYLNDLIVLVVGFDQDVSSDSLCKPTVDLKFTTNARDRYTEQTRNMARLDDAEVTSLLGSGYATKHFDKPFLAFGYRVKDGDNAKSIKDYSIRSATGATTSLCDWTKTADDQSIETTGVKIDTRPARLIQVTTRMEAGTYKVGSVVEISLVFDRNVILEASPVGSEVVLRLNSGGWAKFSGYDKNPIARTSYDTLIFQYIVGNGEFTAIGSSLDLLSVNSDNGIVLNNNIIVTAASMLPAVLVTFPTTSIGSLTKQGINIQRSGYKFPSSWYDKTQFPVAPVITTTGTKQMQTQAFATEAPVARTVEGGVPAPAKPVHVWVQTRVDRVSNLNSKSDEYDADLTVTYSWFDDRFLKKLCKDNAYTTYTAAQYTDDCNDLDFKIDLPFHAINQIWHPQLVAHNTVQNTTLVGKDQKLTIQNNGKITVHAHIVGRFFTAMNVRSYPYDGPVIAFNFRSAVYDSKRVIFESGADAGSMEKIIRDMKDAVFHFIKYKSEVKEETSGNYAGFSVHSTMITAKRRAFQTNMVIVFPIVFILGVVFCAFFLPVRAESRLITLGISAVGTLIINYSLQHNHVGTNHVSRLAILIMFNYIHILYSFLWFVLLRKIQQGLDEYIRRQELQKKDATEKAHSTVAFCITINAENFDARVKLLHTLNVVAGVTYFCFTVITTAVILAAKIQGN